MTRIDLIYFDAGGGHRAAATALKTVLDEQPGAWDARLVNLQELLDPLDLFGKLFGLRIEDIYNLIVKKGWTLGSPELCRVLQAGIRASHRKQLPLLEAHWRRSRPGLVVSLVPHFNRPLCESVRNVCPRSPYVTVLTDLADYPPHFWIERQEQYLICGSDHAVEQARALGHPEGRIFRASGMILNPRFYQTPALDRRAERKRLGLDPELATGLVLFGGAGSNVMLDIAKRLDRSGLPLQLILVCGHNEKLARRLRQYQSRTPLFVEGFTADMPYYMRLADFFIGKPGPGSISEALAMRLPVIVVRNASTLPQERYNADWVLEKQVGFVVRSFRKIDDVVGRLIEPATLASYRANAAAIENRAVFEIPEILERIIKAGSSPRY